MKKKKLIISVLAILLVIFVGCIFIFQKKHTTISTIKSTGANFQKIENADNKSIAATVNDKPIYVNKLQGEMYLYNYRYNQQEQDLKNRKIPESYKNNIVQKTQTEVLDDLILTEIINQQCEKLNISATSKQASDYVSTTNSQSSKKNLDSESVKAWTTYLDFIKGTGLTLNQYDLKYSIPNALDTMNNKNLNNYFIKNIEPKSVTDFTQQNTDFNKYLTNLKKSYTIKILIK